jgi:tetratricopeptide (TPR) repeat protein
MADPTPPLASGAVQDIERRMRWSASATVVFLFLQVSLLIAAALAIFAPPRTAHGLPDTPDVTRARALLHDQVLMAGADLRFRSVLTGEWGPAMPAPPGQRSRLLEARTLLKAAAREMPLDARAHTALAHAELGLREMRSATLGYRVALELAPHYAEAHLGLGTALAETARSTPDTHERHRLRLQAVAHFIAVEETSELYACALHNHVVVLLELGRTEEAHALGRVALERAPDSPWVGQLRDALGRGT